MVLAADQICRLLVGTVHRFFPPNRRSVRRCRLLLERDAHGPVGCLVGPEPGRASGRTRQDTGPRMWNRAGSLDEDGRKRSSAQEKGRFNHRNVAACGFL